MSAFRAYAAAGAAFAALALLGCSGQADQARTEVGDSGIGLAEGPAVDAENAVPSTAPETAAPADTAPESVGSPGGDADQSGELSGESDTVPGSEQHEEAEPAAVSVESAEPEPGPDPAVEVVEGLGSDPDLGFAVEVIDELAPSEPEGGSRQAEPVEPVGADEADGAGGSGGVSSALGDVYTWHDGDRTLQARLQLDLVVLDDGAIAKQDEIVADTAFGQIVNRAAGSADGAAGAEGTSSGHPVFLSESGTLMTLPGGVIVVLDERWDTDGTDAFFARNSISLNRVSELSYLANGFLVETSPGFASLDLANELAGQVGVELSSPNWWRERTTK